MPKEQRISVRVPVQFPELKKRLRRAAKIAGISETAFVLAALRAACDFVEKAGGVMSPMGAKLFMEQLFDGGAEKPKS